jgi:hypothetical protein
MRFLCADIADRSVALALYIDNAPLSRLDALPTDRAQTRRRALTRPVADKLKQASETTASG